MQYNTAHHIYDVLYCKKHSDLFYSLKYHFHKPLKGAAQALLTQRCL